MPLRFKASSATSTLASTSSSSSSTAHLLARPLHRLRPLVSSAATTPSTSLNRPATRPFSTSSTSMFALTPYRGAAGTSQPKTLSRQKSLPRLPIPKLDATLERYLKSLEPILLQKEEFGELKGSSAKDELAKRRKWAEELQESGGLGWKLQHRLIDVDRTTTNNWLDDRYWLVKAYHEWRVPLLINSNWWLMFRADRGTPLAKLEETTGNEQAELTKDYDVAGLEGVGLGSQQWDQSEWGIRRATWLIGRFLEFKQRLDSEDIMPDASRAGAFCMHQYTRLFGVSRIPALPHDWNTEQQHPVGAKHITVAARDNFYRLDVLNDDGSTKPLADVEKALWDIVNDAKQADGQGVGVLTVDDRDTWAKAREHLLSSQENAASLRDVEDSLFIVCIDSSNVGLPQGHPAPPHQASPASVDAHARNTSGAARSGHNRWFDKALTITVEPNGRAGVMGEHSPCDALIPSIVGDFAAAEPAPAPGTPFPAPRVESQSGSTPPTWKKLKWTVDETTQASIASAEAKAKEIAKNSDIRMLWFDEFGAEWMKKIGKQSPDAFIQVALQLAYAKMAGRQTATYETASTRLYKHGRTDVIRSFSTEAYEFVKAVRNGKPSAELYSLLSKATVAHNSQTKASSTGSGVDRHLTGLRLVYDSSRDGDMPSLFTDPLFAESQTWTLSTSGLSAGDRFCGTGFGAGYEDGYGINYLAGSSLLKFGIESKHSCEKTSTTEFAIQIVEALRTMRKICEEEAPKDQGGKTKL